LLQAITAFLKINRTNADNRFMYWEQGSRNRPILQERGKPISIWGLFRLAGKRLHDHAQDFHN